MELPDAFLGADPPHDSQRGGVLLLAENAQGIGKEARLAGKIPAPLLADQAAFATFCSRPRWFL